MQQGIDILLVEDNPNDAELILRALKKNNLANHVLHAADGAQALDLLLGDGNTDKESRYPPRVVLLDLKLPKMSGLEVLKAIRQQPRTRDLPVVIVTSSREDPDIRRAYELGANSYVVKPVDFDQFVHAMSEVGMYWLLINQPPAQANRKG